MDDKKLNSFVTVVNVGSITKASESLYMSPTAVMRQIDALESELGVTLFQRTASGCEPTQAGLLLYDRARIILREMDEIQRQLRELAKSSNTLTICAGDTYSMITLDQFSAAFSDIHPEVTVQYLPSDIRHWFSFIRSKKADCAFLTKPIIMQHLEHDLLYIPVLTSRFVAVVNPNHPLSKKTKLNLSDLSGYSIRMSCESMPDLCQLLTEQGAHVEDSKDSPSSANIFNICQKQQIYITIDLMTPQYRPLVVIPIDYPVTECGFVTRQHQTEPLKAYIETAKKIDIMC